MTTLRRALLLVTLAVSAWVGVASAYAQAVYQYTGQPFTRFSCGPNANNTATATCIGAPAPGNPLTSYLSTDFVAATLTLTSPLPANMALTDIRGFAGFQLTLSDGRQTLTNPMDTVGMFAQVATDATGNIASWRFALGGIATRNTPDVQDSGALACCHPTVPGDLAFNQNLPGSWGPAGPAAAVRHLTTVVASAALTLTAGQVNSLSDKLTNVLASIEAGLDKQAINQLNAFISSVETAGRLGKMSPQAAARLIGDARAIIVMLGG
jgi:hypothetical protein